MEFLTLTGFGTLVQVIGREPSEEELKMVEEGDMTLIRYQWNRFQVCEHSLDGRAIWVGVPHG